MIVVDTSALLEVLLNTPSAPGVADRILADEEELHIPHLLDLEVAQVLRRYEATDQLSSDRAAEALDDLASLPLLRYPHDLLLPRVWELRSNATAYDAVFLALAEVLDATLVTRDARLARSPGHRARVEVV